MMRGKVYLVGAGPGDPGLITVRAVDVLRSAEIVLYDRLVNPELLEYPPVGAQRIFVGKLPHGRGSTQDEINRLMIEHARSGQTVVRLKGGDPFIFGRGGEEAQVLRAAGIKFEVVPGVSSFAAAPAYAGIPLTHRKFSSSFCVLTGHEGSNKTLPAVDWERLATAADTLVVLMGVETLPRIVARLLAGGRTPETPVVIIQRATFARQQVVSGTLENIVARAQLLEPPAVIVIGDVAALHSSLAWFDEPQRTLSVKADNGAGQICIDA